MRCYGVGVKHENVYQIGDYKYNFYFYFYFCCSPPFFPRSLIYKKFQPAQQKFHPHDLPHRWVCFICAVLCWSLAFEL